MSLKQFDANKAKVGDPVITRSGLDGRVICLNRACNLYPVVVLIKQGCGEDVHTYTEKGSCSFRVKDQGYDIFFPPKKVKGWCNVYPTSNSNYSFGDIHTTKELADSCAHPERIAVIQVEFEV